MWLGSREIYIAPKLKPNESEADFLNKRAVTEPGAGRNWDSVKIRRDPEKRHQIHGKSARKETLDYRFFRWEKAVQTAEIIP